MIDFSKPFKSFVLTEPTRVGQNALCFEVLEVTPTGVLLTDPSWGWNGHPLLITESDSDWVDWGDDFVMPEPLFQMMFGVEPVVGMITVLYRAG